MKKRLLTLHLLFLVFGIIPISASSGAVETGSRPWTIRNSSAEATAKKVVKLLAQRDYFGVYYRVSHDVVNHYKSGLIQFRPDKLGIDLNFGQFALSDFAQRYGTLAYFDQALASISKSTQGWAQRFTSESFQMLTNNIGESLAVFEFSSDKGSLVTLSLVKEKEKWWLREIVFDDFYWPIGMNRIGQQDDADNPVNSPENPKNQPDD